MPIIPHEAAMKLLLLHPGASWSTADVFDGLNYGLKEHGVEVEHYRLDKRIPVSHAALFTAWRKMKKEQPDLPKPNQADIMYHACLLYTSDAADERSSVDL